VGAPEAGAAMAESDAAAEGGQEASVDGAPEAAPVETVSETRMTEPEERLLEPAVRAAAQVSETTQGDLDELRTYLKTNRSDHTARLALARALWKAGELRESLESYGRLIRSRAKMDDVMDDLQAYSEDRPGDPTLLRTLGDAHMKAGNLQTALELFNRAMDLL